MTARSNPLLDDPHFVRPSRRMMVFIDGENLVFRYQEMLKLGYVPRDDLVHERDVFVWHDSFTWLAQYHEIIRASYYTNAVGDEPMLRPYGPDSKSKRTLSTRHRYSQTL